MLLMDMKLMQSLFNRAEDGDIEIFETFVSRWIDKKATIKPFRGSANFVLLVQNDDDRYFLRFNEEEMRSTQELKAEIDYLLFLKSEGNNIGTPVESLQGNYVETFDIDDTIFNAVMFKEVKGKQLECDELSSEYFRLWGRSMAKMHSASKCYPVDTRRKDWETLLDDAMNLVPEENSIFTRVCMDIRQRLNKLPRDREVYGLIHFDMEQDNLIWKDKEVHAIDFDDCSYHWFIADIAYALRDIFDDGKKIDLSHEGFKAFMEGYRSCASAGEFWIDQLPLMYEFHKIIQYAHISRSFKNVDPENETSWARKLRERHEIYLKELEKGFTK